MGGSTVLPLVEELNGLLFLGTGLLRNRLETGRSSLKDIMSKRIGTGSDGRTIKYYRRALSLWHDPEAFVRTNRAAVSVEDGRRIA